MFEFYGHQSGVTVMTNAQRTRVAIGAIWISWSLFLIAFVLPATNLVSTANTRPGDPVSGLVTFAGSIQLWGWLPILAFAEPRALLFLIFPFTNQAMFAAPLFVSCRTPVASVFLALVFAIGGVLPWFLPGSLTGTLFSGFYVWDASFFLMALSYCLLATDELN